MKKIFLFSFAVTLCLLPVVSQNKTALIIGNSEYEHFPVLRQPGNEAGLLYDALTRIGFEVILLTDASGDDIYDGLQEFEERLRRNGGIALFHYGGHGVQVDGDNYLIPVDADIPDERRVKSRAVNVDEIIGIMEVSECLANIVILDACRDNPLPRGSRSGTRGLAVVSHTPLNTIVVYAADAGDTAQDGIFTPALLKYIETPGLELTDMLRMVRTDVRNASGGRQRTGEYNQLESEIYLAGRETFSETAVEPQSERSSEGAVVFSRNYMDSEQEIFEGWVAVDGGTFRMGSAKGYSDEKPVHPVTVSGFMIGRYEVTQKQFSEVMGFEPSASDRGIGDEYPVNNVSWFDAIKFCNSLSEKEGLEPVYLIEDRNASCDRTKNGYRLPTEAEWEFAARGGRKNRGYVFSGSNNIEPVGWYRDNSSGQNHPVGEKEENALGIYDMTGNVSEWCWDRFGDYPASGQQDPSGTSSGADRIQRGGSRYHSENDCRVSRRIYDDPYNKMDDVGFRLVRSLVGN